MDLSIASEIVYPDCPFSDYSDLISKDNFFDNLRSKFEDAWDKRT